MISNQAAEAILESLQSSNNVGFALRKEAMELISALPGYNWSGIYRLEDGVLMLDEYVGAPTDHTRIKVGVGVCGTAVAQNANQVVDDVRTLENYLACSLQTRSEIVVLIRKGDSILGQIDIDGHAVSQFDSTDERFLERVAEILAENWQEAK